MVQKILDLHIHSKYSRACSKDLTLPMISRTCAVRGIDIVATGDFTHPKWFEHIKEELVEDIFGMYRLAPHLSPLPWGEEGVESVSTKFIVGTEVACIKKHKGETRRVHLLLFAPSLEVAERFNTTLEDRGYNVRSDGRPILGLTCHDLLELMLGVDERMVMIPAHAWTPWFGVFGSKGGYDTLEEAFDDLTPHIRAIETGLSSDPLMNRQCSWLDNITLISNSDAHSSAKLGREANVLAFPSEESITYDAIMRIIQDGKRDSFLRTIEFYPEEGKYHFDGHRACSFSCHPNDTKKYGGLCPKCKRPLVIGVMNRVMERADRSEAEAKELLQTKQVPYTSSVPLVEILADTFRVGWNTKTVRNVYERLIQEVGNEFFILLHAPLSAIEAASSAAIVKAIDRVRQGNIHVVPGYDGEFGVVKVFAEGEDRGGMKQLDIEY